MTTHPKGEARARLPEWMLWAAALALVTLSSGCAGTRRPSRHARAHDNPRLFEVTELRVPENLVAEAPDLSARLARVPVSVIREVWEGRRHVYHVVIPHASPVDVEEALASGRFAPRRVHLRLRRSLRDPTATEVRIEVERSAPAARRALRRWQRAAALSSVQGLWKRMPTLPSHAHCAANQDGTRTLLFQYGSIRRPVRPELRLHAADYLQRQLPDGVSVEAEDEDRIVISARRRIGR